MTYLISQILLFIILAAVVGFLTGWLIRGRGVNVKQRTSENEWSVKYHIQENEIVRLQTELDELKTHQPVVKPNRVTPEKSSNTVVQSSEALPFSSAADKQSQDDVPTVDASENPLERLRAKLELIEKEETMTISSAQDDEQHSEEYHNESEIRKKDDLKQIIGIDDELEARLNGLGVYRFKQIAHFSEDNIVWVDEYQQFKGLIEENDWVGQAKRLMQQIPE